MKRWFSLCFVTVLIAMLGLMPAHAVDSGSAPDEDKGVGINRSIDIQQIAHDRKLTEYEEKALVTTRVMETYLVLDDGATADTVSMQRDAGVDATALAGNIEPTASYSGCGTAYVTVKDYNSVGQKLYQMATSQYWCWRNSVVTRYNTMQVKVTVTSLGQLMGWSWSGFVDGPSTSKRSSFIYRTWVQGHFVFSPVRVGTVQHTYPWVQMDIKGDGTYYARRGF